MPEGLQFASQEQWLMSYIDSLERTIITQAGARRLTEKQLECVESMCNTLLASGQDQKMDAAQQILDVVKLV
jgi:hypothetical protein